MKNLNVFNSKILKNWCIKIKYSINKLKIYENVKN